MIVLAENVQFNVYYKHIIDQCIDTEFFIEKTFS